MQRPCDCSSHWHLPWASVQQGSASGLRMLLPPGKRVLRAAPSSEMSDPGAASFAVKAKTRMKSRFRFRTETNDRLWNSMAARR